MLDLRLRQPSDPGRHRRDPERTDRPGQTARAVPATAGGGRRRAWRVERGVVGGDAARQQHLEQPHRAAGRPADCRQSERLTYFNMVSAGWFQTYGTPMLAGRDFTSADTPGAPRVAIVNEAFARRFTGGRNPVGTRVRAQGANRRIVGYVRDAVYESLRAAVPPTLYLPYGQADAVAARPRRSACARPADRPRC